MTDEPPRPLQIAARTVVQPSEDVEKVRLALERVFNGIRSNYDDRLRLVTLETDNPRSLLLIHHQVRDRAVLSVARRLLLKGLKEGFTEFMLNKQAALGGLAVFCDEPSESPLGPVHVVISSDRILEVIDWLTPQLGRGHP